MKSSLSRVEIKVLRLAHGLGLPLPQYQTAQAAGLDLIAAVPLTAPLRLLPGMRQLVPTGLTIEIPIGYEGQIRPRSGLALNHGVTVLNAPGTVDADYRGEVQVLLINHGRETFVVTRGQRIAQLVIQAVARAEMIDVRAVAASRRGEAGWGSTGSAASMEATKPAEAAKAAKPAAREPAAAIAAAAPERKVSVVSQAKPAVPGPFKAGQAKSAQHKPAKAAAAVKAPAKTPTAKSSPTKPNPNAGKASTAKRPAPTSANARSKAAARA